MSEGSQDRVGIVDRDNAAAVRALERCLGGANPILVSDEQDYRMGVPIGSGLSIRGVFHDPCRKTHYDPRLQALSGEGRGFGADDSVFGQLRIRSSRRSIEDVPVGHSPTLG